ncbi:hypothetical protein [Micromonospora cathayae]|uniref:Gram-positive cocci surface proteins LPxTG domain-containing protein n=1 Tax=Micromonospora cathayae TaxID=3028804 RepID=A0ABY7ZZF1_9ACTN|nr:hypothetical protein [Micromonospora sp. HUAS 3]WDZ87269.1 hypothetical protein PVK37_13090 [Micromonospora sp. HUAS 3]
MIRLTALAGLMASVALAAPSPVAGDDAEFTVYQTFTASAGSGDPGAPALAVWIRDAVACETSGGGSADLDRLAADFTLRADARVVFGVGLDDQEESEYGSAGVVLRGGPAEFLALAPVAGTEPGRVALDISCRASDGSWTTIVKHTWEHPGFESLPLLMPDAEVEQGAPVAVYDVTGVYQEQLVDPAVFTAEIDGIVATIEPADENGAAAVRPKEPPRPGVHVLTLTFEGRELVTPFVQRDGASAGPSPVAGSSSPAEPAAAAGPASSNPGRWAWPLTAGSALVVVLVTIVVLRRRRR